MVRVLYIATRKPLPVTGGRDRMIVQSLSMLKNKYQVGLLYFEKDPDSSEDTRAEITRELELSLVEPLYFPSIPELLLNFLFQRRKSLQERFFFSRAACRKIHATLTAFKPDIVIADMIRCGQFVEDEDIPKVLEMDDLLSERYRRFSRNMSADDDLLGTFSAIFPRAITRLVNRHLKPLVLRHETLKIGLREKEVVTSFDVVTLVSHREAEELKATTGASTIHSIPPTVRGVSTGTLSESILPCRFLFFGNLLTNQNLASIRYIIDEVLPALERRGFNYILDIAGNYDDRAAMIAQRNPRVHLLGYVSSVDGLFAEYNIFLTPIAFGSGIKTKILDAMAHGIPVVTNDIGIEGIPANHDKECLIANSPEEIAASVVRLFGDVAFMRKISENGKKMVDRYFLYEKVERDYLRLIAGLVR